MGSAGSDNEQQKTVLEVLRMGDPPILLGLRIRSPNSGYSVRNTNEHSYEEDERPVEEKNCDRVIGGQVAAQGTRAVNYTYAY